MRHRVQKHRSFPTREASRESTSRGKLGLWVVLGAGSFRESTPNDTSSRLKPTTQDKNDLKPRHGGDLGELRSVLP